MSYTINKYNGEELTTVNDGTINTTCDISLIGKNAARYGEAQNENFVFLLENFAGIYSPPKAILGQLWFDTITNQLKYYDNNLSWKTTSGIISSSIQPSDSSVGNIWFNTTSNKLYIWNGTQWLLIGPSSDISWVRNYGKTETLTVSGGNFTETAITFDNGFVDAPVITTANILSSSNILISLNLSIESITNTGMTIKCGNGSGTEVTCVIAWSAEGI